jgi:uncharacterized membrane protein YdjX (TVP38/TMEM64 family)
MDPAEESRAPPLPPPQPPPADAGPPPGDSLWARFKHYVKRLGPAGPLAVMASTFPPIGGFILLGFIGSVAPWLQSHKGLGLFIYVTGFALSAALSLLPTYASSILGGWTFGFWVGWPAAMFAFTAATIIAWVVNTNVAGDRVLRIIEEHPKWEAVRKALIGSGFWKSFWILTLARVPPTSPFALMNFVVSTTKAPLLAYLLATVVGMAPRTAVAVWAAAHASTLNFKDTTDTWMYVLGLVVTIVVIAVIGHVANKAIHAATREREAEPSNPAAGPA